MAIDYLDGNQAHRKAVGSHAGDTGDPDVSMETVNNTLTTTVTGAPITGQSLEAGGSGVLGWLASVRKAITDRLPAALTGSGNLKVSLAESTASQAVTQSGTWTVQPGNTANTTAWKMDGSAVTQPVSGAGAGVKVALTVTAAAYSAGNSIGGLITIANAVRVSGGVSILASIQILDRANQKPTGTIYIFDANPTNATLTDKTAFVFSTDDLKVIAQIPVVSTDYVTTNSKASASLANLARVVQAASGTTLYAAFVPTSTPTFAATTDVQLIFNLVYVN